MKLPIKYRNKYENIVDCVKPESLCNKCTKLECFSMINLITKFVNILKINNGLEYMIKYLGWYLVNHCNIINSNSITELLILDKLTEIYDKYGINIINKWIELIFGLKMINIDKFGRNYETVNEIDWSPSYANCSIDLKIHTEKLDVDFDIVNQINRTIDLLLEFEKKTNITECILMVLSKLVRFINYWSDYIDIYSFDKNVNIIKLSQLPDSTIKFIGLDLTSMNESIIDEDGFFLVDEKAVHLYSKTGYHTIDEYISNNVIPNNLTEFQLPDFEQLTILMNRQIKMRWYNNNCIGNVIEIDNVLKIVKDVDGVIVGDFIINSIYNHYCDLTPIDIFLPTSLIIYNNYWINQESYFEKYIPNVRLNNKTMIDHNEYYNLIDDKTISIWELSNDFNLFLRIHFINIINNDDRYKLRRIINYIHSNMNINILSVSVSFNSVCIPYNGIDMITTKRTVIYFDDYYFSKIGKLDFEIISNRYLKYLDKFNLSVINSIQCNLCLNQIYIPEYRLQCGHIYHNQCVLQIKTDKKSLIGISDINCPYCLCDFGI